LPLKNAFQEGLNRPLVEKFDSDENLKRLKAEIRKNSNFEENSYDKKR